MEPILAKADNYSFLKKLVENVKETKDAQAPDDEEVNKVKKSIWVISSNVENVVYSFARRTLLRVRSRYAGEIWKRGFIWLGLTSTLIRPKNGENTLEPAAIWKRLCRALVWMWL